MTSALQSSPEERHSIPRISSDLASQPLPALSPRPTRNSPKLPYGLTTFARSLLLLSCCALFNVICWTTSGILFGHRKSTTDVLSLCLLAWVFSWVLLSVPWHPLRHLYAIDNATRSLINLNQLPVTCGLYFSLGHSTIVIAVNVAIAISSDVYNKINGVGNVGSIIGAAVSGSFLFLIALANSIILWRLLRRRRRAKSKRRQLDQGVVKSEEEDDRRQGETSGLMMRILGPVTTFVNRPWKMYPVGVLFGFGFDTASSIALIAITALAKKGADGKSIPRGSIIILPFLFTAGMSLVDSVDSVLMLYSYAGFTEQHKWALIKRKSSHITTETSDPRLPGDKSNQISATELNRGQPPIGSGSEDNISALQTSLLDPETSSGQRGQSHIDVPDRVGNTLETGGESLTTDPANTSAPVVLEPEDREHRNRAKLNVMSNLSIVLTLVSILVALSISLVTIMGLIGDHCGSCQEAANSEDGGGLAGDWWRGWAKANENSGFIGAAIVGGFVVIVAGWYAVRWTVRKWAGVTTMA